MPAAFSATLRPSLFRWLAVLSLLVNAVLILMPQPPSVPLFPYEDKVVHLVLFGAPAVFGLLAGWRARVLLPGLFAYAVATEVIQGTLESATRSGSVGDLIADAVGIGSGWIVARLMARHTGQ